MTDIYVNQKGYSLDYIRNSMMKDAYGRFVGRFPYLFTSEITVKKYLDCLFKITGDARIITEQLNKAVEQGSLTPEQEKAKAKLCSDTEAGIITHPSQIYMNSKGINLDFVKNWTMRDAFSRLVDRMPDITNEEEAKRMYFATWDRHRMALKTEDNNIIGEHILKEMRSNLNRQVKTNNKGYNLNFIEYLHIHNLVCELIDREPDAEWTSTEANVRKEYDKWVAEVKKRADGRRWTEVLLNQLKYMLGKGGSPAIVKKGKDGYAAQRQRISKMFSDVEGTKRTVEGMIADLCFYHMDEQEAIVEFFITPYWKSEFGTMGGKLQKWVAENGIYQKYDWKSSYVLNLREGMCPYVDWQLRLADVNGYDRQPQQGQPHQAEMTENDLNFDFSGVPVTGQDIPQEEQG